MTPFMVKKQAEAKGFENRARNDFSKIKPRVATGMVAITILQKTEPPVDGRLIIERNPPPMR